LIVSALIQCDDLFGSNLFGDSGTLLIQLTWGNANKINATDFQGWLVFAGWMVY